LGRYAIVHLDSHAMRNMISSISDRLYCVNVPAITMGDRNRECCGAPIVTTRNSDCLGLDLEGRPVGDQVWTYGGYLGESFNNTLVRPTYFNGQKVSPFD
jgi:hypothetical protein